MPYISDDLRDSAHLAVGTDSWNIGSLTYMLYKACIVALPDNPRYSDYNALLGALECTKLELYRRHIAPYENERLAEHGDVY